MKTPDHWPKPDRRIGMPGRPWILPEDCYLGPVRNFITSQDLKAMGGKPWRAE